MTVITTIKLWNDPSSGITAAKFNRDVAALTYQMVNHVCPAYGLPAPVVEILTSKPTTAFQAGVLLLSTVGAIVDDPSAQGYHTVEDDGLIDGYVSTEGIDEGGFTECQGHEMAEGLVDPDVSLTYIAPNGDVYPKEVCDAVQNMRYPIDLGDGQPPVMVPNFVLPAYWGSPAGVGSKVDYMGLLSGPFTIGPDGYSAIYRNGQQIQIGASMRKPHALSRPARRRVILLGA